MPVFEYLSPFIAGVRTMLHPSVHADAARARIHLAFLASRLVGVGVALVAFPLYLALQGAPDLVATFAFALLMTPLAPAMLVSLTGRLEAGQSLSSGICAGLVVVTVLAAGGSAWVLLPWIALFPLETLLSGSRRVLGVVSATALGGVAGAGLVAATGMASQGAMPPLAHGVIPALAALPVLLNLGALGVMASSRMSVTPASGPGCNYRQLVEDGPDLLTRHRRNGNVTSATVASERLLGAGADEVLGDGLFRRINVADRPAYLKAIDDAASGRDVTVELRIRRDQSAQPAFAWFEMACRSTLGPQGDSEVVASLRNIETRKAGERELVSACEEAERTSLAKSRFLARISHELRTPLNAVIGFSEILAKEMLGKLEQDRHRDYAHMIHDSGCHLLDLINDILDMSRIEAGNFEICPEPFELPALVDACSQMLEPQARQAGLRIETDLAANLPELTADRRACKQILLNLLQNAVKFSNQGGRIVVGTYLEESMACLYVADEGIGISREDVRRLGQPFVQVHSSYDCQYGGTGLGLSVVKGLAGLHGGTMQIDSEPGAGTQVTVRLPVEQPVELQSGQQVAGSRQPTEMQRLSA